MGSVGEVGGEIVAEELGASTLASGPSRSRMVMAWRWSTNSSSMKLHPCPGGGGLAGFVSVALMTHSCTSLHRVSRTQAVAVTGTNFPRNCSRCVCQAEATSTCLDGSDGSGSISAASMRESFVNMSSASCEEHRYQLLPALTSPCGSTTVVCAEDRVL